MADPIRSGTIDLQEGAHFTVGIATYAGKRSIVLACHDPVTGVKGWPITDNIALQLIDGLQRALAFTEQ